MKKLIIATVGSIGLSFCGCATIPIKNIPYTVQAIEPYVYTATKFACSAALATVKDTNNRKELANQIYEIADAVDAISGGVLPETDKIEAIIKLYSDKTVDLDRYDGIVSSIADIYKEQYAKIKDDPALALKILGDMARGARDAARKMK